MSKPFLNTRTLAALALLAAVEVVLARFIIPMPSATMRFSIEAVPIIIAGLLFGALPGAAVGVIGDAVGCLFSAYGYNPVFAVPPLLIGLCAGLLRFLLYEKITFPRVLATFLPAFIVGSVLWQSWWLAFFYGTHSFVWFLGARAAQFTVTAVIDAAIVLALFKGRAFEALRLWPPENAHRGKNGGRDA